MKMRLVLGELFAFRSFAAGTGFVEAVDPNLSPLARDDQVAAIALAPAQVHTLYAGGATGGRVYALRLADPP